MRRISVFLFAILSFFLAKGQDIRAIAPSIPTSPQADAFKRYGDFNINYSTGVPNISIPLFEIDHRGYNIPIKLKYYPQPLKQGYNYDVVGKGWALSLNSLISRTIEFAADEKLDFIIDQPSGLYKDCGDCLTGRNYGHDKFHVILPDRSSFDFVIDNVNGALEYTISGDRHVKIACTYTALNIQSFEVIDENGVKYTFSDGDVYGPTELSQNNFVSWVLSRIDLPTSAEPIIFNYYQSINNTYGTVEKNIDLSDYFDPNGEKENLLSPYVDSPPYFSYKMKLLSSIGYGGRSVVLSYKDQSLTSSKNYLDDIRIYDGQSLLKTIVLKTSVRNIVSSAGSVPLAKLDTVLIKGSSTLDIPLRYICTYTGIATPFKGTDYWGYLNHNSDAPGVSGVANFNLYAGWTTSRENSYSTMGICEAQKMPGDNCPLYKIKLADYDGFSRAPGFVSEHGILNKLTYPTGGYTEFEFGNHQFLTSTDNNGDYIMDYNKRVASTAGGFRIEKITNYAEDGKLSDIKNFRYGPTYVEVYKPGEGYDYEIENCPNCHTGLGEAVVDPNILTFMNFSTFLSGSNPPFQVSFPFQNLVVGIDEGKNELLYNPFTSTNYPMSQTEYAWRANFNASNFRKLVNGRSPVIYSQVTVYDGDVDEYSNSFPKGKTVYHYDIMSEGYDLFNEFHENIFFEQLYYAGNILISEHKESLYDKFTEKKDYSFNGQEFALVRKELNEWSLIIVDSPSDWVFINLYPNPYYPDYTVMGDLLASEVPYLGDVSLGSKVTVSYFANDSISNREFYGYNNRNQIVSRIIENSNNEWTKRIFEYPEIEYFGPTPLVIQKMVDKNIITPVIKDSLLIGDSPPYE